MFKTALWCSFLNKAAKEAILSRRVSPSANAAWTKFSARRGGRKFLRCTDEDTNKFCLQRSWDPFLFRISQKFVHPHIVKEAGSRGSCRLAGGAFFKAIRFHPRHAPPEPVHEKRGSSQGPQAKTPELLPAPSVEIGRTLWQLFFISQLPSSALFPLLFLGRLPFKQNPKKKDALFSPGHWASKISFAAVAGGTPAPLPRAEG